MSPTIKNITAILVTLTLAFIGYYLYSQNKNASLSSDSSVSSTQDMLISTQIFIERRVLLENVKLETQVFSNPLFRSYRSFELLVNDQNVGRTNPFSDTDSQRVNNNF